MQYTKASAADIRHDVSRVKPLLGRKLFQNAVKVRVSSGGRMRQGKFRLGYWFAADSANHIGDRFGWFFLPLPTRSVLLGTAVFKPEIRGFSGKFGNITFAALLPGSAVFLRILFLSPAPAGLLEIFATAAVFTIVPVVPWRLSVFPALPVIVSIVAFIVAPIAASRASAALSARIVAAVAGTVRRTPGTIRTAVPGVPLI
jgi:hypothetical protein